MGTILTGLVLLIIVTAVIFQIHLNKKKNRCAGCSRGCGICDDEQGIS